MGLHLLLCLPQLTKFLCLKMLSIHFSNWVYWFSSLFFFVCRLDDNHRQIPRHFYFLACFFLVFPRSRCLQCPLRCPPLLLLPLLPLRFQNFLDSFFVSFPFLKAPVYLFAFALIPPRLVAFRAVLLLVRMLVPLLIRQNRHCFLVCPLVS